MGFKNGMPPEDFIIGLRALADHIQETIINSKEFDEKPDLKVVDNNSVGESMGSYGLLVVKNNDEIEQEKKATEAANRVPDLYESQLSRHIQSVWEMKNAKADPGSRWI